VWGLLLPALPAAAGELTRQQIYEKQIIEQTLAELGLEADGHPAGKVIERVVVARHPIIEPSDPWPGFLNLFHLVTREHVIRRELLFAAGQPYDENRVRESARILRALPMVFAVVRIVTARASRPDRVVVVVITKDLWSLRLNSQFSIGGGVFNYLSLMPTEQNFLGLAQRLSLYTFIDRDTYSLGEIYTIPRLLGSRLQVSESLHARLNHHSGELEGGFGGVSLSRPLFSLATEWGFALGGWFDIGTRRSYQGVNLRQFCLEDNGQQQCLPWLWQSRAFEGWAQAVRSWGRLHKLNLLLGYAIRSVTYNLPATEEAIPAELERQFRSQVMPQDEQATELLASVSYFQARYARLHNVQSYGLTEDFRLGPSASAQLALAHPALGPGFERRSLRLGLALGWNLLLGTQDILAVNLSGSARWWPDHGIIEARQSGSNWVDRLLQFSVENVSPPLLGLGRLLVRLHYAYSQYSTTASRFYLGGDNTLRGFVSGYLSGQRLLNINVEFRTLPIVLWTLHWGLVLFYDGGDAYDFGPENDFAYHQSLGLGIRGLFPQFDIEALRLDIGIPLGRDFNDRFIDWITVSYRQAF